MPEYAGIYRPNDRPNRHTNRPKLEAAESVWSVTTPPPRSHPTPAFQRGRAIKRNTTVAVRFTRTRLERCGPIVSFLSLEVTPQQRPRTSLPGDRRSHGPGHRELLRDLLELGKAHRPDWGSGGPSPWAMPRGLPKREASRSTAAQRAPRIADSDTPLETRRFSSRP